MRSIIWTLWNILHPSIDALFGRNITFAQRWRMLLFMQPLLFLTNSIGKIPWYSALTGKTEYITVDDGRTIRVVVFKAKETTDDKSNKTNGKLRPLHLDIHGGGFIGGVPEYDAGFCDLLARSTGAVVISTTYRFAPRYPFPAAIDDVDAVVRYLQAHARERWDADPELMTVSGGSAGGNLAMASIQQPACHGQAPTAFKAAVIYHGLMNLRLKPLEKPRPLDAAGNDRLPKRDPALLLLPLMDAYAEHARPDHMDDPRLSPMLAKLETLPKDVLLIVPVVDILVHEELTFAERIKSEIEADPDGEGKGRSFEAVVYEEGFHGWTELPEAIAGPSRTEAINRGVNFLKKVLQKHGWEWTSE